MESLVPEHVPVFQRVYVTLPPAVLDEFDSVEVSWTVVPTATEVTAEPAEFVTMVEIDGVK